MAALTRATGGPVDPKYKELASKYGASEGEVALRWCIDKGVVAITTSASEQRLRSYLSKIPSFTLTANEVDEIAELGKRKHYRGFWARNFDPTDKS